MTSPKSNASVRTVVDKMREAGLVAVLSAGAVLFAVLMSRHYPIGSWLFFRYVGYWAASLAWAGLCAAFGVRVLDRGFGATMLTTLERVALGLPLGVFAFGLSIFLLGLTHALHPIMFFALPVAFGIAGGPCIVSACRSACHYVQRDPLAGISRWTLPALAFGLLGIAALYIQVITPEAFSFDSRWYHLPMAQRYALSGAVARFPEGFWMSAYPQLATYLFTWVFLAPLPILFDRLELCAHLEFVLFFATLAQIPALVRVLVPNAKAGLSWVVLFLFPAIYLYDSNLHAGADHIAALFAIPIALTFWRTYHDFSARNALLSAIFLSAATLTKYTAIIIVVPPALALLWRAPWLCAKQRSLTALKALGVLVLASLVLTSSHWLKNWLWYGDPIYPMLYKHLAVRPWNPDVPVQMALLEDVARPATFNADGLLNAARAMFTFSFVANDWYVLRHNVPMFGSLFTLTLPCLLFVRGGRRLIWLYAGSMLSVFVWYLLSHYERFLQALLPWMVAATAACMLQIWQTGRWARLALLPLVALQLIWGSDVPFIRTHNLIGDSPLRRAALLIPSGFEGVTGRLNVYEPLTTLGASLPHDAVVLAHDVIMILGIDRNWITDQHQNRISYGRLLKPRAIHDELVQLGVTHLIWTEGSLGRDSLAGDLAFFNYAINYTEPVLKTGGYSVARLRAIAPETMHDDERVAVLACSGPYSTGLYRLSQLTVPVISAGPRPAPEAAVRSLDEAAAAADLIAIDRACSQAQPPATFVRAASRGTVQLYVKLQPLAR